MGETIANEFDIAEDEIKKVKKMFNLEAANADLKKRQDILKKSTDTIDGLFASINANMATMSITIPEDKKKILTKEIKAVEAKLEVTGRFKSTVTKIEELVAALTAFDGSLRSELPGPWTSRKTLQPSWKSSKDVQALSKHSCPKETRFQLMPRPSRMSLQGSPSTSQNSRLTPRLSATNTPTMSSSGLSTELVSRNSPLGC